MTRHTPREMSFQKSKYQGLICSSQPGSQRWQVGEVSSIVTLSRRLLPVQPQQAQSPLRQLHLHATLGNNKLTIHLMATASLRRKNARGKRSQPIQSLRRSSDQNRARVLENKINNLIKRTKHPKRTWTSQLWVMILTSSRMTRLRNLPKDLCKEALLMDSW